MTDPNDVPVTPDPAAVGDSTGPPADSPRANGKRDSRRLPDRVRVLEEAVAHLQTTQLAEDAMADRVIVRLTALAAERRLAAPDGALIDPLGVARPLALSGTHAPAAPPGGAVLHPPEPGDPSRRPWFLGQFGAELRMIGRMYFDPRYRVSRTAQFALPAILLLFVLNYFLFGVWFAIPVISPVLERVVCVALAIFFYKILTRELARYREVLDYLARYGFQ